MIFKAAQLEMSKGGSLAGIFKDSSQISAWARNAVLAAYQNNVICSYIDGNYHAKARGSRAESATIIVNTRELAG